MSVIDGVNMTPVERAAAVSDLVGREVFVKRDDLTHATYGGNKARKLKHLLAFAQERDATDLVTFGARGSHHVLATTLHGRELGMRTHAVTLAHPFSEDSERSFAAAVGAGCDIIEASGSFNAFMQMQRVRRRLKRAGKRPYVIPPGGSTARASVGFFDAATELAEQLDGQPWPTKIFCAVGSGGMCAGLLAGLHAVDAPTQLVGVQVRKGIASKAWYVTRMARKTHRLVTGARVSKRALRDRLLITDEPCGAEYGEPHELADAAKLHFAADGIVLDRTYTSKTAAALIAMSTADQRPGSYLLWQSYAAPPAS